MKTKAFALLAVLTFLGVGRGQAQVKYLDCGIDFSCPYFSG
jgi:hypothetical protein